MNGAKLSKTCSEKYLGVNIMHNLSWKKHIEIVKANCYQKLGIIQRNFRKCNQNVREKLFKQLVLPKIDYCSNVWFPQTPGLMKVTERIQRKAAGIVTGKRVEDYAQVCSNLKWLPLHVRSECQGVSFIYRIINSLADVGFSRYFSPKMGRPLRQKNCMQIERKCARTVMCQNSYFYRVVNEWNILPNDIVFSRSYDCFKLSLANYMHGLKDKYCHICCAI